ncbi:MAG: hypothetical protein CVT84_01485 [Alphaproteobacteria bacterium HGW-Alphaproteobacteria-6]|nr:MAG: hypothetical protein CVT84_01485 [Alphaproteobacteria bacterium HGW-Alphaproteobacteria-6]
MWARRTVVTALALAGVSACARTQPSKFRSYDGPEVTQILVIKGDRVMHLLNERKALKTYKVDLGFDPVGHKVSEGDGRTPEGLYRIDRRNPNSTYHLSLGISYPNAADIAKAKALGKEPGGDIFIHGAARKNWGKIGTPDWTAGCISVTDDEMEEVYAMVRDGTPIFIRA